MTHVPGNLQRIANRYAAFAVDEARGASAIYEKLALDIAASPELLAFIASLPADRQQPNLFLAAVRYLCGVPRDADGLIGQVRQYGTRIRELMLSRTTQTNEPGRCSVLLPLLAQLPQPLALIEVGASAGLCLIPDRYGYDYGVKRIEPLQAEGPVFPCSVKGAMPLPARAPRIVWRLGLDLSPIDLSSADAVKWLETLVWPDQPERLARLRAATSVARSDPPRVVRGDLLTELEPLIAAAPKHTTLVVFHTAVLAYVVRQAQRDHFAETVRRAGAVWISNETPRTFPHLATSAAPAPARGHFLLMLNGRPVAWTAPHGQSIDWFGPP
jgi:hypothetical protein